MRLASILTLTALAAVTSAAASPEDRYGPPAESPAGQAAPINSGGDTAGPVYRGPFLHWAGKTATAPAQTAPTPSVPVATAAAPIRLASLPAPRQAMMDSYTPPLSPQPAAPIYPVVSPYRPPPPETAMDLAPRRVQGPAPTAHPADLSPTPAPTLVASASPATGGPAAATRTRYYSLHRDYGDAPDPISLPAARPPVLIGPLGGGDAAGEDASHSGRAKPRPTEDSPAF